MGANLSIAVAKLVGGLLSGSVAMLAEAAHSVGDTVTEVLLFVSLGLGARPADQRHPFGYGKERFFWAFLAAVFIFVGGAAFSWVEGVRALLSPEDEEDYGIAFVVLGVAFVAESVSFARAVRQSRRSAAAHHRSLRRHLRLTRDPTVKVVVLEDSAAIVGVAIAAAAIGLHEITGDGRWDGVGSIGVGCVLAFVAVRLGRDTRDLLIGSAAAPEERSAIADAIASDPAVEDIVEVMTMAVGPDSLLVAARVDLRDELSAEDVEEGAARIEATVRAAVPAVGQFFLDPTGRTG